MVTAFRTDATNCSVWVLKNHQNDWRNVGCVDVDSTFSGENSVTIEGKRAASCDPGFLTAVGQAQLETLGAVLAESYFPRLGIDNVGEVTQDLELTSTDVRRTLTSLESLVRGMFPKSKEPITAHVLPFSQEILLPPENCARLILFEEIMHLDPQYNRHQQELERKSREALPVEFRADQDYDIKPFNLIDNYYCMKCRGLDFCDEENCLKEADAQEIAKEFSDQWKFEMEYTADDNDIHRLRLGLFFGKLIQKVGSAKKFHVFSAHDTTLALLQSAFRTDLYHWPPYASAFVIEIYNSADTGDRFVRLVFNEHNHIQLKWCGNRELCPMEVFLQLLQLLSIEDLEQECSIRDLTRD